VALQLGALRNARAEAGASPDAARKAAEEVAGYENRISKVEADLATLKWMVGVNIGLTLLVVGKSFFP
jgi:hypothetical protein